MYGFFAVTKMLIDGHLFAVFILVKCGLFILPTSASTLLTNFPAVSKF